MKFNSNIKKFQEGGQMAPQAAPAPEAQGGAPQQGGSPEEQIIQAAMQAVQGQDCQTAMMVCQALVEMAQGGGGGGEAPAQEAPPAEPTFARNGSKLKRI